MPMWILRLSALVVIATIPICIFNAFYYNNPIWLIPAAVAFAIMYAG